MTREAMSIFEQIHLKIIDVATRFPEFVTKFKK